MSKPLSRRDMLSRAGLAIGGAVAFGAIQACSSEDDPAVCPDPEACPEPVECPAPTECENPNPLPTAFPYEDHISASFQFDLATVQEEAYHGYFAAPGTTAMRGCCFGTYSGLLADLQRQVGKPFTHLPVNFGLFGSGGIAGFGSACGATLGGIFIINMIVKGASRNPMITDLLRWYERTPFPQYLPQTVNGGENSAILSYTAESIADAQTIAASHLCHTSLSHWGSTKGVPVNGPDKHARCARLCADVAKRVATVLNTYLAGSRTYTASFALDTSSAGCVSCHPATALKTSPTLAGPNASAMQCSTCHPTQTTYPHPK
jgi:hypothetical protein